MKIRTNYVSNSSSSSFVVICKKIGEFKDLDKLLLEKDKTYFVLGEWLDEGIDYIEFKRDDSLCNFLKEHCNKLTIDSPVYQVFNLAENQVDLSRDLLKEILPGDNVTAMSIDIDYHSTTNPEEARYMYYGD